MYRALISRRSIVWMVLLIFFLVFLFVTPQRFTFEGILQSVARSQLRQNTPLLIEASDSFSLDSSEIFDTHTPLLPNRHLSPLLRCSYKVNSKTNSIRLPQPILNISLTPPDSAQRSSSRYFNPAIIPLPPYSPYPYLLLSRLVTAGLHQESHICLATACVLQNLTSPSRPIPADSKICSGSDIEVLGHHGGIRCATEPQRLNIPPTPALQCEGAWSAFPDIPGFHDPRVFWSGKGEPLVIINSASQYACVGLWVVDLRAVYPEIQDLLTRQGKYTRLNMRKIDSQLDIASVMSYPRLTELTRNPRKSRSSVEKNWILFFPRADESWIQYDLVGHAEHKPGKEQAQRDNATLSLATVAISDEMRYDNISKVISQPQNSNMTSVNPEHETVRRRYNSSSEPSSASTVIANSTELWHKHVEKLKKSVEIRHHELVPSRTFAKIIGSGYTTQNLTSANESPCLTSANLFDGLGNSGRWHQGSNSLRLVLCSRQDTACLANDNEHELVSQGMVVHFAILHRKFSNDLDLPMRYERYIMVWEARFPFRMVGLSQYPILFAGERAQPWSDTENELDGDSEAERWTDVYFTYTPSLAWGWRKQSARLDTGDGNTRLGTGYLGDDIVVGIGMDDTAQGFVRVKVDELLSCLRLCPDFLEMN